MANLTQKVTAALAASAALLTARAASATELPVKATIVLHVDNFANLPSETLNLAEKLTAAIFADAGVSMVWVDAGEKRPRRDGERHLKVLLLSREMGERKIAADGVGADVLGQAARVAGRAYIFTHRVEELAGRHDLEIGRVLARIIAHETGHLLLPVNGHTATGIMCERLDLRSKVDGRFTSEQSALIRRAVAVSAN
jgi:hypothetical protein